MSNLEDLEEFISKVDDAHAQILALSKDEISLEEVDAKQKKLADEKKMKENVKKQKEFAEDEKVRKGQSGKGEGENYSHFCRNCFVEYTRETPVCLHCDKKTMTREERRNELKSKVEEYKKRKVAKDERKSKWENWRKTQAIYWKKTSTNYSKWDYFTSSEEEDANQEPILPKNDPNFLAMEKDLEERMKKKEADRKVALEMKAEGNDYLTKRDYYKAIESYTVGMQRMKDMKELYTNRALAYMKLGNYEKCIEDCSYMLEFTEIFEKGFEKSANLCLKALMRRAQAYKEIKKLDEALEDMEQALKLSPKDKDCLRLKEELKLQKQQEEKVKAFKEEPEVEEKEEEEARRPEVKEATTADVEVNASDTKLCKSLLQDFLEQENPSKELMEKIVSIFKKNSDYKIFANELNFAKKLNTLFKRNDVDRLVYLLTILFIQDNPVYMDQFFKHTAPSSLLKRLREKAEDFQKNGEKKAEFFQDMEEIFEVFLNITENEKGRILLKDQTYLTEFLDSFFGPIMSNLREEKEAATSYFGLITNLSVISAKFTQYLKTNYLDKMMEPLVEKVFKKQKTSKYNRMKENLYGLLANLLRDDQIRVKFLNEDATINSFFKYTLESMDSFAILNPANLKWIKSVENILAIFINMAFGVTDELRKKIFVQRLDLLNHVRRFMGLSVQRKEYIAVLLRALQLLSRFEFEASFIEGHKDLFVYSFEAHFSQRAKEVEITNHAIRMYAKWFAKANEGALRKTFSGDDLKPLVKNLVQIIKEENEERFVNATLLIGNVADVYPECSDSFRECISPLLHICREKMGVIRKNAAICVAKLSKTPGNLQVIRDQKGIEVLSNISKFILDKN